MIKTNLLSLFAQLKITKPIIGAIIQKAIRGNPNTKRHPSQTTKATIAKNISMTMIAPTVPATSVFFSCVFAGETEELFPVSPFSPVSSDGK